MLALGISGVSKQGFCDCGIFLPSYLRHKQALIHCQALKKLCTLCGARRSTSLFTRCNPCQTQTAYLHSFASCSLQPYLTRIYRCGTSTNLSLWKMRQQVDCKWWYLTKFLSHNPGDNNVHFNIIQQSEPQSVTFCSV